LLEPEATTVNNQEYLEPQATKDSGARTAWYRKLKIVFSIIFILCLVLFNASQRSLKSREAREFENWLNETEEVLIENTVPLTQAITTQESPETDDSSLLVAPSIKVTASFADGNTMIFHVGKESDTKKALRILQLIRETNVFSAEQASEPADGDPLITVEVSDENNHFVRSVRHLTISEKSSTGVLFKLLQTYSH
jgi:hypothetical protein